MGRGPKKLQMDRWGHTPVKGSESRVLFKEAAEMSPLNCNTARIQNQRPRGSDQGRGARGVSWDA